MVCRLCLCKLLNNSFIPIFDENDTEIGVSKVIAKYFHLELRLDDSVSNKICSNCWEKLDTFHKFCLQIEQKQIILLQQCKWALKTDTCEDVKNVLPPEEEELQLESINPEVNIKDVLEECEIDDNNDPTIEASSDSSEDEKLNQVSPNRLSRKCKKSVPPPLRNSDPDVEPLVPSIKRKRGRPKKGEEKPKPLVKKKKSEKHIEYYRISREFDEKIAKHMKLNCNLCTCLLQNFGDLKRHFRSAHKCRGYAVCCNKRLYKKSLVVDHINTHINPEHFKCNECNKVLADRMCLRNHMLLMHQSEQDKIYQCEGCPRKFAKQYLLDHHKVKHASESERTFICDTCGKGFPTKSTLNMHVNFLHTNTYSNMCEICAKVIRGKAAFEKHQLAHAGIIEPTVQCEVCATWLKDKNSLRKHMYRHKEDKEQSNICNICGKVAPSKSALSSHYSYVHTAERRHICTVCEKGFKKPKALKEHMATHTGEMLYSCPHCPRTFKSSANMHSHRKKVHRTEWEEARINRPITNNIPMEENTQQNADTSIETKLLTT